MSSVIALLQTTQQALPPVGESGVVGAYIRVLSILAVLIAVALLLLRVISARMPGFRGRVGPGSLELVDKLVIDPKRSVHVVRAGSRFLAVASSENGLQLLAELNPADFRVPVGGLDVGEGKDS